MPRTDWDHRSNKMIPSKNARYLSKSKIEAIVSESRERTKPKKGIRESVLEIYYNEGIVAAYAALAEYNKKIGKTLYTPDMLQRWIIEEQRKKGFGENDGFDR